MKPNLNATLVLATLLFAMASPAFAQSIDLSPIQTLLQVIVGAITGPPGIVIGTLALIGVFLSRLFGILDFRQALWVLVAIAGNRQSYRIALPKMTLSWVPRSSTSQSG